jgi:hypothetical protein
MLFGKPLHTFPDHALGRDTFAATLSAALFFLCGPGVLFAMLALVALGRGAFLPFQFAIDDFA